MPSLPRAAPLRQAVKIEDDGWKSPPAPAILLGGMAGRIESFMLPEPAPGQPRASTGAGAAAAKASQGTGPQNRASQEERHHFRARAMRHPAASANPSGIKALRSRAGKMMIKANIKQRQT